MFPGEGPGVPGQPDDDREAGVPPHPARPDPRRSDREPDGRAAVPGAAGDPPRFGEQPALAGLPPGPLPGPGGLGRLVARPGRRIDRRRRTRRRPSPPTSSTTSCGSSWASGWRCPCRISSTIDEGRRRAAARRSAAAAGPGRDSPRGAPDQPEGADRRGRTPGAAIPPDELTVLLERLKTFAKRVHRSRPSTAAAIGESGPRAAGSRTRCRSRSRRSSTTSPAPWP